ncbi:MAG: hypothetical protein L3J23_01040 [Flavobacteriaceae bacterium]|nr:hypothetical protein [Flavobacteriaceae bacterium]
MLSKNNQIIFNEVFFSGESRSLTSINIGEFEKLKTEQWTGKIFKDKPVMFGFFYKSFGCSWINVLSKLEETIPVLCDNRH